MASDETIKSTGIYYTITQAEKTLDTNTAAGMAEFIAELDRVAREQRELLGRNLAKAMQIAKWAAKRAGGRCVRCNEVALKWRFIPPAEWPTKPHNAKEVFDDAERLNTKLYCLRGAMRSGNIRSAVQEALMVGKLTEKLRIRPFERAVMKYANSREGARKSHEPGERRDAEIKALMDGKLSSRKNLSVNAAAIKVAQVYSEDHDPISAKTVTRIYKKSS
jgi:hypothetical protein